MTSTEAQLEVAKFFTKALTELEVLADIQAEMFDFAFSGQKGIINTNWKFVDDKLNTMLRAADNEPQMTLDDPLSLLHRLTAVFVKLQRTSERDRPWFLCAFSSRTPCCLRKKSRQLKR